MLLSYISLPDVSLLHGNESNKALKQDLDTLGVRAFTSDNSTPNFLQGPSSNGNAPLPHTIPFGSNISAQKHQATGLGDVIPKSLTISSELPRTSHFDGQLNNISTMNISQSHQVNLEAPLLDNLRSIGHTIVDSNRVQPAPKKPSPQKVLISDNGHPIGSAKGKIIKIPALVEVDIQGDDGAVFRFHLKADDPLRTVMQAYSGIL